MEFRNPDLPLTEAQIAECETSCGIRFPKALRESYLTANGGAPMPYIFDSENIETVVSRFLPLLTDNPKRLTAIEVFRHRVVEEPLVPPTFFPFAVDGGGDFFYADTATSHGAVYFYNSDGDHDNPLVDLEMGVAEFWEALTPDEDD